MHEQIWIMIKWIGIISCIGFWFIGIIYYLLKDLDKDKK